MTTDTAASECGHERQRWWWWTAAVHATNDIVVARLEGVPAVAGLDLERVDAALHAEEAGLAPE